MMSSSASIPRRRFVPDLCVYVFVLGKITNYGNISKALIRKEAGWKFLKWTPRPELK